MRRRAFLAAVGTTAFGGCLSSARKPGVYGDVSGGNQPYGLEVVDLDDPDGWVDSIEAEPKVGAQIYELGDDPDASTPVETDVVLVRVDLRDDERSAQIRVIEEWITVGLDISNSVDVHLNRRDRYTFAIEKIEWRFPSIVPIPVETPVEMGRFSFSLRRVDQ